MDSCWKKYQYSMAHYIKIDIQVCTENKQVQVEYLKVQFNTNICDSDLDPSSG